MTPRPARHGVIFCATALVVAAVFWWLREPGPPRNPVARAKSDFPATSATTGVTKPGGSVASSPLATGSEPVLEGESQVADALNAPGGPIQRDLQILNEVFEMWLTNFPREGNPVGENAEIAVALTGDNPHRFAFVPRRHRAINDRGELCDRWGTPFRFHQLSGRQMEIRSAGPDRKFGTTDDAAWPPE